MAKSRHFYRHFVEIFIIFIILIYNLLKLKKILPQKKGIEKSLWVKKFIKRVDYSKDEIAVTAYYGKNPGEEVVKSDASGWVRAKCAPDSIYKNLIISL